MSICDLQENIEEKLVSARCSTAIGKVCEKRVPTSSPPGLLNPLKEYTKFGDYTHKQEESIDIERDWHQWLPVLDTCSVAVLKRIILTRQEFWPESYSYLTEEEKSAHKKLLTFFEGETPKQNARSVSQSSSAVESSIE